MDRIAGVLLCLAILGGLVLRLRRGLNLLFGKPKSSLHQLSGQTDDIKSLNDKNRKI